MKTLLLKAFRSKTTATITAVIVLVLLVPQAVISATFTTPTQITSATGFNDQAQPQIAVDSNGYSHITWQGRHPITDGAYQIWYADNSSGSWSTPTQISAATDNYGQFNPRIAVDSSGYSHIAWHGSHPTVGGAYQIWYADNTSGSWSAPVQLTSATGSNNQTGTKIAIESDGKSHIVWQGPNPTTGGTQQIWYTDNASGSWSATVQLTSATGSNTQQYPEIGLDSNGRSHVTWHGYHPTTGSPNQIWYADDTSGSWSIPVQITSATGSNGQLLPQIAVDSGGKSHITWYGFHPTAGGPHQIWYADDTSGSWSTPVQLTNAPGGEQLAPRIGLDSNGYSHVTWHGLNPAGGTPYQIWYADNTSGSWSTPAELTGATGSNDQTEPRIAVDPNGKSHITWWGNSPAIGAPYQIWYADNTSGSWPTPTQVSSATGSNNQTKSQIAVDSASNPHVAWNGSHPTDGGPFQIWYSGPRPPALDVIKGVSFYEGTPGSPVEYGIVIENKGDYDAMNVSVNDDIPANTTLVPGTVTCTDAGASIDSEDPVKITGITVNKGDVVVITFQVTINEDTAPGTVIQNQGFVTCGTETIPSSNPGNPGEGSPTDVTVVEKILGSTAWIVPEGSTGGGFDTFILIQNPNNDPAPIKTALATEDGLQTFAEFEIPPASRTTLRLSELLPNEWSISTLVASEVPVVVERSMYWNKSEPSPYGNPDIYPYEMTSGHANLGLPAPMSTNLEMDSSIERAKNQYFPEGSTAGFDTWILLFNPNEAEAQARVTLMDSTGPVVEQDVTIGPLSRKTVHLNKLLPNANEVATRVESASFLVAERSMYWDPAASEKQPYEMIGGHATSGSPVTATNWYVAEGSTGGGFETYVLLQNPSDNEAPVNVTFMNGAGTSNTTSLTMPAQSRSTLKLSDYVPDDFHVSTSVTSDVPIVAERSMYWDKRETTDPTSMKDGHSCIGTTGTSGTWMVSEGSTGGGFDTFVLITNTENTEAQATVTFMTEEGAREPMDITIPADSRYTLWVNEHLPNVFQVSTLVNSESELVVERSMYWDNRELSPDGNFPARPFECKGGHSANGMDP